MKTTRGPSFPLSLVAVFLLWPLFPRSDSLETNEAAGDKSLADYFYAETAKLSERCLSDLDKL